MTARARAGLRRQAYDEVQDTLHKLRHLSPHDPDDFSLSTPDQIVKQFDSVTGMIVMVAIAISGLGLLVGGISVMNIILVSVTERTREIGVRKAIGVRRRDIIIQFLFEAVTLTGVGGIIGIVFAVLVTVLIGALVSSMPSVVPVWALITGFAVSVGVGIFFGVWPAVKAERLNPVDALRYERLPGASVRRPRLAHRARVVKLTDHAQTLQPHTNHARSAGAGDCPRLL